MRIFWQVTALFMLVLFAPASMHCMAAKSADKAPVNSVSEVSDSDCSHPSKESPSGHDTQEEHDCPTETLAKSSLPAPVLIPELPCGDSSDIASWIQRINDALLLTEEVENTLPPDDTNGLQSSWIFSSRAALPARWPSELA